MKAQKWESKFNTYKHIYIFLISIYFQTIRPITADLSRSVFSANGKRQGCFNLVYKGLWIYILKAIQSNFCFYIYLTLSCKVAGKF